MRAVSEQLVKTIATLEDYKSNEVKLQIAKTVLFFTLEAADSVHDLLIAVILVALVMLFFLHSIRNSLIVMVSIPFFNCHFYWNLSVRIYLKLNEFIGIVFGCGYSSR
jgi:multidrug efflux pump subunit AcrB